MLGISVSNAQFLLQAPNSGDENNYQWFEASDTGTVLGQQLQQLLGIQL